MVILFKDETRTVFPPEMQFYIFLGFQHNRVGIKQIILNLQVATVNEIQVSQYVL